MTANAVAVLLRAGDTVSQSLTSAELDHPDWRGLAVAELSMATSEPLRRWRLSRAAREWGLSLEVEALCAPCSLLASGYTQLCRLRGEATVGGVTHDVDCLGERRHSWGVIDWSAVASERALGLWLPPDDGLLFEARRSQGRAGHDEDEVVAARIEAGSAIAIEEPRLSTTLDGGGRPRRAGLELWIGAEDEYALRVGGERVGGASIERREARHELAFMDWSLDGRHGAGLYELTGPP